MQNAPSMSQAALDVLVINRRGGLSPEQSDALAALHRATGGWKLPEGLSLGQLFMWLMFPFRHMTEADTRLNYYPRMPARAAIVRDHAKPRVEEAPGECRTPRECWVDGLDERSFPIAGLALWPGRYSFLYLPNTRLIVNAVPLEPLNAYLARHRAALRELLGSYPAGVASRRGVKSMEGIAMPCDSWNNDVHDYAMVIGKELLKLEAPADAVTFGLRYRAYHQGSELLALEPLDGPCGLALPSR